MWMQDIWEGSNPVLNIKHPCSRERDAFRGQSFKLFLLRNLRLAGIRKVLTGGFSWLWNEISSLLKNAPETLGPYLLEPPPRIGLEENLFGICCPFLLIKTEVSESHFFILETRMRVSLIQSRTSRREQEFLTLNLRLRDETEKKSPLISGNEKRSRFIIFNLRHRDENENSLDLISVFETRMRILKVAIFPWIQAWTASLFCMQFLGG